ncbi:hypothetical protein L1049_016537 [Liquidambar formosana]|uniref:Uncharacterized protein n=1 Tax=Liquidambar formosana TaxID=63359 RepID=A0AAP0RZL0_LIQFO
MDDLHALVMEAIFNFAVAFGMLLIYATLQLRKVYHRIHLSDFFTRGIRNIRFSNWLPASWIISEDEIVKHAGLDYAAYVQMYLLGLKIFVPMTVFSCGVLLPINWMGGAIDDDLTFRDIDKLSIFNVPRGSKWLRAHQVVYIMFSFSVYYWGFNCYKKMYTSRCHFLESKNCTPDEFTMLVTNIPSDPEKSITQNVEDHFRKNHPHEYLLHQVVYNTKKLVNLLAKKKCLQNELIYYEKVFAKTPSERPMKKTGFWGIYGTSVDAIGHCRTKIETLREEETAERQRIVDDPMAILPAAFVSFKTRRGAAICATTQRLSKSWLIDWAPEPTDVVWNNLGIRYSELTIRRLVMGCGLFSVMVFSGIAVAFAQALSDIDVIGVFPFLQLLGEMNVVRSYIQDFLASMALKMIFIVLPTILRNLSKIEGLSSFSFLERRTAGKYYLIILFCFFPWSIVIEAALQHMNGFVNLSLTGIPQIFRVSVSSNGFFFISYIMVDGWLGNAADLVGLFPLLVFPLKKLFLAQTEDAAVDPSLDFSTFEPQLQFFFLIGFIYAVINPFLLPFLAVFFISGCPILRHQVINVYKQMHDSGARFWPDIHQHLISGLIMSHLVVMGIFITKDAENCTLMLIILLVSTSSFDTYCKRRFKSVFVKFPDAWINERTRREGAAETNLALTRFLRDAYVHPDVKTN